MQLTRRGFVGGIVASATMAEAGALAELMNWLRRKPVSVMSPAKGWPPAPGEYGYGAAEDAEAVARATRLYFSRDNVSWEELKGVRNVDIRKIFAAPPPPLGVSSVPFLDNITVPPSRTRITVIGDGFFPLFDIDDIEHFRMELASGVKINGVLGIEEVTQYSDSRNAEHAHAAYSFRGSVLDR